MLNLNIGGNKAIRRIKLNKKSIRAFLITTGLAIGLSASMPANAHAAEYTAVSGDSLYKISKLFSTSVANLMVVNNLTNYTLNTGQVLNIPRVKYTVNAGDTLYKISQKHNIKLSDLRKANNIYTNYIYAGQVLDIPVSQSAQQEQAYTPEDLDLLSRLIMAEAQGEPYEAKVAVGAVVMNRIKSGLFPTSIKDVIYQNINGYYQFTPVVNEWINKPSNEECIRAAKEALSGVDNTNGALFYYDTTTTNPWILSKEVSVKFGSMIYAY